MRRSQQTKSKRTYLLVENSLLLRPLAGVCQLRIAAVVRVNSIYASRHVRTRITRDLLQLVAARGAAVEAWIDLVPVGGSLQSLDLSWILGAVQRPHIRLLHVLGLGHARIGTLHQNVWQRVLAVIQTLVHHRIRQIVRLPRHSLLKLLHLSELIGILNHSFGTCCVEVLGGGVGISSIRLDGRAWPSLGGVAYALATHRGDNSTMDVGAWWDIGVWCVCNIFAANLSLDPLIVTLILQGLLFGLFLGL